MVGGPVWRTYPGQWARCSCMMTNSQVLKEKQALSLGQAQRTWWVQYTSCPLATPQPRGGRDGFLTHPPPRGLRSQPLGPSSLLCPGQEGQPCASRCTGAVGVRPGVHTQLHQAALKRDPGGSILCEALWSVSGLVGSRLDHTGPRAPNPLKSSSQNCPQSQPHPPGAWPCT